MRKSLNLAVCLFWILAMIPVVAGQERHEEKTTVPFLQQTLTGGGGLMLVPTAYLSNPPGGATRVGSLTTGGHFATMGDKTIYSVSLAETVEVPGGMDLELGYAYTNLQLGDARANVEEDTTPPGLDMGTNHVALHTVGARLNLLKENAFNTNWVPALTLGGHWKKNNDLSAIRRGLTFRAGSIAPGVPSSDIDTMETVMGIEDDETVEATLFASKKVTEPLTGRPLYLTAGARYTDAAHMGLWGFSDDHKVQLEGSVAYLVTDWLGVTGEYKSKPGYDEWRDATTGETIIYDGDDWWNVGVTCMAADSLSLSVGYIHWGKVLDEDVGGGMFTSLNCRF